MTHSKLFLLSIIICVTITKLSAQKVNLNFNEASLSSIFSVVTQQTGYSFAYSSSIINVEKKVSILVKDAELEETLELLFLHTDIIFEIGDSKIYLTKRHKDHTENQDIKKISISGIITDKSKNVLSGASIIEKGTANGTTTGYNGEYSIEVRPNAILIVNYLGYITKEIKVTHHKTINIKLEENIKELEEVVITALGIEKRENSLPYSVQQIDNIETTQAKEHNFINSLAGKASNVIINKNSSGLGASSRVIIRGLRSTISDNQPLYVLDGVPILNTNSEYALNLIGGTANAGNRDGGDGISNLNPEDMESINILKGSSASALYGSRAANGVILITTKKGQKGLREIRYSSGITFDKAISLPKFQNSYANVENSTIGNWGEKTNMEKYDNLDGFFSTGFTAFNSLVITEGRETVQSYISYGNTTAVGIIDNNKLKRHNLNIRQTIALYNGWLTIDPNVNIIIQQIENKPVSGGYYMNSLVGLYTFPRGESIQVYKDNFEIYDPTRNMYKQNWYTSVNDGFEQNPYWLKNRVNVNDIRIRTMASLTANLRINNYLNIQGRGCFDFLNDKHTQKIYASTSVALVGENGRYIYLSYQDLLIYGDVMAVYKQDFNNFDINAMLGASIDDYRNKKLRYDSGQASLYYPNLFTIANIKISTDAYIEEKAPRSQSQSVFLSAQAGYKKSVYLDITARNEWHSTLASTNSEKSGFFYPSVGSSFLLDRLFNLPEWISLGKIRGSWSKTGTGIEPHITNDAKSTVSAGGNFQKYTVLIMGELTPAMTNSLEFGLDWRFFEYRLCADLTMYKTNTTNQLFSLSITPGSGSTKGYYVSSGNIENKGIELTLTGIPFLTRDFIWQTQLNYSKNINTILKIHDDMKEIIYGTEGVSINYTMMLREGDSFDDIYGVVFERDENGNILYTEDGLPIASSSGNIQKVGNCNPDYLISLGNTFKYKNISLYFLLDGHFGGKVLSQTQAILDQKGLSKVTADARDLGYVELEGRSITKIEEFYQIVGGRSEVTEYYMYDATNIRLREIVLEYNFPEKWMNRINFVKNIQLSLSGRNLFFLYKKAPFDPDATLSTANDNLGVDVFGIPMTRSIGFNVRFVFN